MRSRTGCSELSTVPQLQRSHGRGRAKTRKHSCRSRRSAPGLLPPAPCYGLGVYVVETADHAQLNYQVAEDEPAKLNPSGLAGNSPDTGTGYSVIDPTSP